MFVSLLVSVFVYVSVSEFWLSLCVCVSVFVSESVSVCVCVLCVGLFVDGRGSREPTVPSPFFHPPNRVATQSKDLRSKLAPFGMETTHHGFPRGSLLFLERPLSGMCFGGMDVYMSPI